VLKDPVGLVELQLKCSTKYEWEWAAMGARPTCSVSWRMTSTAKIGSVIRN